jgi:acyl carrier protein
MDVRAKLEELLAEQGFEVAGRPDGTNLREELAIDSTALVDIAMAIERGLSVPIDGGLFQAVETIGDMVRFVRGRLPAASTAPLT